MDQGITRTNRFYRGYGKRGFDLLVAGSLLLASGPLLLCLIAAARLIHGPPAFFRQRRPGWRTREFTMFKLRTMTDAWDPEGRPLPDEQRLTAFGRFLRATSLDELPQLWNVLRGEMSLVGPRPLLTEYLPRYTSEQNRRHDVRPGITGWAQVNGRQEIPFSKRLSLDVWYVDHQSFWLDLRVLWLSATQAFFGRGVRSGQDVRLVDDLGLHEETRRSGSQEVQRDHGRQRRAA